MHILCPVGARGGPEQARSIAALLGTAHPLTILHVIDERPRHDLERLASPLRQGPRGGPDRRAALAGAEERSGQEILAEALAEAQRLGISAITRLERGAPEQVIVAVARQLPADLVVVRAREATEGHPPQGPASVGHTARFVLDHAPAPVLLLR
jgi:nucleotide-binding universal stress UspA family protein